VHAQRTASSSKTTHEYEYNAQEYTSMSSFDIAVPAFPKWGFYSVLCTALANDYGLPCKSLYFMLSARLPIHHPTSICTDHLVDIIPNSMHFVPSLEPPALSNGNRLDSAASESVDTPGKICGSYINCHHPKASTKCGKQVIPLQTDQLTSLQAHALQACLLWYRSCP
jgi:hypothetical protein